MKRLTADPVARAQVGMPRTARAAMLQAIRIGREVDKGIRKRDAAMAKKLGERGIVQDGDVLVVDDRLHREMGQAERNPEDVPFVELEIK